MYAALALLAWKLGPTNLGLFDNTTEYIVYVFLTNLFIYQFLQMYRVNKHIFIKPVPAIERYKFKNVAVLNLAYLVTFGSELAVVSMLPLFFIDTFAVSGVTAGILASSFAFMNLVARPGGGLISDRFGRRHTMIVVLIGLTIGYFLMSQINSDWPIIFAVIVTILCSVFVQSGAGAVFAMVPLIKRRMTGQIAGMTGAYGNVGAVCFLTILSFVPANIFFLVIAVTAIVTLLVVIFFLDEPKGHMAETLPDGTVQMIEVS